METGTTLEAPTGRPARSGRPWAERRRGAWHVVRAGEALGWLLLTAVVILTGERTTTLDSLFAAAAAGDVEEVHLAGLPLTAGGVETMEVRWREGPLHYVAPIVELDGVRLTRGDEAVGASNEVGPWRVPGWVLTGVLVLWVLTLFLLVSGPRPWRATRWAWFWPLYLVPTIGVPAFLLLSGPVPGTPAPRSGRRMLTGGWAFLLALVLDQVVGS